MKQTDQELLLAIAEGDSKAFSEFYDRHSRLIYGALLRQLSNMDNVEQIFQDIFAHAWKTASTYKSELGSPKNWLIRIAYSRTKKLIRATMLNVKNNEMPIFNPIELQTAERSYI